MKIENKETKNRANSLNAECRALRQHNENLVKRYFNTKLYYNYVCNNL